jgi:hypothetical protein
VVSHSILPEAWLILLHTTPFLKVEFWIEMRSYFSNDRP